MNRRSSIPPSTVSYTRGQRSPVFGFVAIAAVLVWMGVNWMVGSLVAAKIAQPLGIDIIQVWRTGMILAASFWFFWLTDLQTSWRLRLVFKAVVAGAFWITFSLVSDRSSLLVAADLCSVVAIGWLGRLWFGLPRWQMTDASVATFHSTRQFSIAAIMMNTLMVAATATVARHFADLNGLFYWTGELAHIAVMAAASTAIFKASLVRKNWVAAILLALWATCFPVAVIGSAMAEGWNLADGWDIMHRDVWAELVDPYLISYACLYGSFCLATLVMSLATFVQSFEPQLPMEPTQS